MLDRNIMKMMSKVYEEVDSGRQVNDFIKILAF